MSEGPTYSGYRLIERIGGGNFCEVWTAEQPGRKAVVKLAHCEIGERMLASEAALSHRLRGIPGVVPVSRLAREPAPHVVMPWVEARTFRARLEQIEDADQRARAFRCFLSALRVIADVHREHVVHGDLKPENILVDAEDQPQLIDFGLAREAQARRLEQTLVNSLASVNELTGGTLDYMPPEAVKGAEPSLAGDVYSLGVMLHEVLLGRRPDKGVAPQVLESLLPAQVVEVLLKALAFEPEQRYRTAGRLYAELRPLYPQLAATGMLRVWNTAVRYSLSGLAAFFVALRYASVLALLGCYAFLLISSCAFPPMLFVFFPFWMLHSVVSWEGPETQEEATARNAQLYLERRRAP